MEMVAEAKTLIVEMVCDVCSEGIMKYDSEIAQMCHIGYPHKCDKCGNIGNYPVRYPYQRIVPIEVLREPVGREIEG